MGRQACFRLPAGFRPVQPFRCENPHRFAGIGAPHRSIAPAAGLGQRWREISRGENKTMLLVTGGAGFIGSNVVASLNEAGRSDVVVNDLLGSDGKWQQPCQAPTRRLRPAVRVDGLAQGPQARCRHSYGRDLRHHRDRRRCGDGEQFPPFAAAARLVHGGAHAIHLCLVGCDLWRPRCRLCRRLVAARRCAGCGR